MESKQPDAIGAAPGPEEAGLEEARPADGAAALEAEVERLNAERADQARSYVRLAADLDNLRKRTARELADSRRYGGLALLTAVLPALDNLSRAVAHLPPGDDDQLATGLRLTVRQLEAALASEGIEPVPSVGVPFDPQLHEAVATEPGGPIEQDTVVAELRPGYRYHDRVVRPAQVRVARAGEPLPAVGADAEAG